MDLSRAHFYFWTTAAAEVPLRWQSPWMLPGVAAGTLMVLVAVAAFYPRQLAAVRRPWRWMLPALRILGLGTLAVSLARPALLRARAAEQRRTVLVLIDHSRSMSVIDSGRRPTDLVSLADGLGLLPPDARPAATARLAGGIDPLQAAAQQAFRAQGDVDYARLSGRGIEPAETRLKDAAAEVKRAATAMVGSAAQLPAQPDPRDVREKIAAVASLADPDGQPTWVADARRRVDAAVAAIARYQDAADARLYGADPVVRQICAALDRQSRFELTARALFQPRTGLIARLSASASISAWAFADDVAPLGALRSASEASLAELPQSRPSNGSKSGNAAMAAMPAVSLPIEADGRGSDPIGAVAATLSRVDPRSVQAVVLLSDGRQVGLEGAAAAGVAAAGVPVYAVDVAPEKAVTRDISFERVLVPQSAFSGETITVRAELRSVGVAVDPANVRLRVNDGAELSPDRRDEKRKAAEFSVKMDRPGAQRLTIWTAPAEGEATAENNTVRRWVKVLPEKIRVAAYAGSAGWDFQYLRSALSRTPWVTLDAEVVGAAAKFPLSAAEILAHDVLILADVPAAALDGAQWEAVHTLVTQRGGSVIVVAGPLSAAADYPSRTYANALVPFSEKTKPAWRTWPGERGSFRPVPPAGLDAERLAALRLEDSAAAGGRWQELPGLFRVMPVFQLASNARPLLVEPELHAAVVTEMRPGIGRAFYVGTDETWRWRYKAGERDQDRFWLQLVRYAAEEPYATREGALSLDADRVSAAPGEGVRIRARVNDDTPPGTGATSHADLVRLELVKDGRSLATYPMSEPIEKSGRLEAIIPAPVEGDYEIQIVGPAPDGGRQRLQVPLHVEASYEAELQNVAGDSDRLRRLADGTGGELLRLDQVARLPSLLIGGTDRRPQVSEVPLWDSPYLFAFVVACFGAEWALRKRFGLA